MLRTEEKQTMKQDTINQAAKSQRLNYSLVLFDFAIIARIKNVKNLWLYVAITNTQTPRQQHGIMNVNDLNNSKNGN